MNDAVTKVSNFNGTLLTDMFPPVMWPQRSAVSAHFLYREVNSLAISVALGCGSSCFRTSSKSMVVSHEGFGGVLVAAAGEPPVQHSPTSWHSSMPWMFRMQLPHPSYPLQQRTPPTTVQSVGVHVHMLYAGLGPQT